MSRPFECLFCGYRAESAEALHQHWTLVHRPTLEQRAWPTLWPFSSRQTYVYTFAMRTYTPSPHIPH